MTSKHYECSDGVVVGEATGHDWVIGGAAYGIPLIIYGN